MSPPSNQLKIATRGSRLALAQAQTVADALEKIHGISVTLEVVKTTGDVDQRPFGAIGGKGLFTSEIERVVHEGFADLAVHSAKDLTADIAAGCVIAAVPRRASPEDVVVGGIGATGEERIGSLPAGAQVGTSSMRRRALLAEARSDLRAVELRGNLDTRMRKVEEGVVDAAILAAAGLERLPGVTAEIAKLDPSWWVPAPGQGALAIEARIDRTDVIEMLGAISDADSMVELQLERAFAARLEGGCSVPLGCLARVSGNEVAATGYLGRPGGGVGLRDRISGPVGHAAAMGRELAQAILDCGGDEIIEELREAEPPEVSPP